MSGGSSSSVDKAPSNQRSGNCPPASELSAFSRGALPLGALHSIAEHVSVCAACDSKVSTLVSELAHRRTEVEQKVSARGAASADDGHLDLAEARIDASAPRPPVAEEEGPTAPLRLGQYRLMRQIGRGGMGVVYQARHERLHRDVAIKFVPVETIHDLFDVERLQREMAAAGTLRHPNVVYATDAGESEGVHYLVMEYVEGIDLSRLVSRIGPLPVADACEIIRQAAEGLAHVEQQQLVHRDLKPSNLMLAADGTVKILDLGLARLQTAAEDATELTRNGYLLGTIDYVAPEQARDAHAADIRSDIYSLGCTFYKLLTGGPPFCGPGQKSVAGKILAHERQPPPPLSQHRTDVPPDVERVLLRMLAKNPADRIQSPLELKRALRPLTTGADLAALLARAQVAAPTAHGRPALSVASGPTTIASTPQKRSTVGRLPVPPRATLAGVGVVIVVAVTLVALWLGGWLPGIVGVGKTQRRPAPTIEDVLAAPNRGQIDYPFPERRYGIEGTVASPEAGALRLDSEVIQLVRLGYLRDDARRVSFEIDQSADAWKGQVGLFLGYYEDPVNGLVGEFQLILLERNLATGGPTMPFQAARMRAIIGPAKGTPYPFLDKATYALSKRPIPIPQGREPLPVLIEFSGRGLERQISRIVIGGVELDDMTDRADPRPRLNLTPRDYVGAVGLFNYGDLGGATFRNFDLSHLEKE